jgi:hypothetical protein
MGSSQIETLDNQAEPSLPQEEEEPSWQQAAFQPEEHQELAIAVAA